MKSYGYDFLVQVDERLLNKGMSALFYTGKLKISGTYAFVDGIPDELKGFTEVKYKVRLRNEPYVDLKGQVENGLGKLGIRFSVEAVLTVLTGVDIELDVDFGATAQIKFNPITGQLSYNLSETSIYDMYINDKLKFHKNVLDRVNEIIKILLKHYMSEEIKEIKLPITLNHLELPTMPDGEANLLTVREADVIILDNRILAAGINFFEHTGGSFEGMVNLTNGTGIFANLKTDVLKDISKFWWERTELDKKREFDGKLSVNAKKLLAKGMDLFLRGITLGFIQPETEIKNSELIYNGSVEVLELPEFVFMEGTKAQIKNLKINVEVNAHIDIESSRVIKLDTSGPVPDKLTPWEDDRKLSDNTKKESILKIDDTIVVTIETATCAVTVDDKNRLALKVVEADIELDFGKRWYDNFTERIMNSFLDFLEKNIVGKIPPIAISPALLLSDVNVLGYTFDLNVARVELNSDEVAFWGDMKVRELAEKSIAVPLYIGNTKSQRLHRFDCQVVEEIDFTRRVGYHGVYEAMTDGFKPCKECLSGYGQ